MLSSIGVCWGDSKKENIIMVPSSGQGEFDIRLIDFGSCDLITDPQYVGVHTMVDIVRGHNYEVQGKVAYVDHHSDCIFIFFLKQYFKC